MEGTESDPKTELYSVASPEEAAHPDVFLVRTVTSGRNSRTQPFYIERRKGSDLDDSCRCKTGLESIPFREEF